MTDDFTNRKEGEEEDRDISAVEKISAFLRRKKGKKARPFYYQERREDFIFFRRFGLFVSSAVTLGKRMIFWGSREFS